MTTKPPQPAVSETPLEQAFREISGDPMLRSRQQVISAITERAEEIEAQRPTASTLGAVTISIPEGCRPAAIRGVIGTPSFELVCQWDAPHGDYESTLGAGDGGGQGSWMGQALHDFTEYFVKNYPGPNTTIFDPKWHAPQIFKNALWNIEQAQKRDALTASAQPRGVPIADVAISQGNFCQPDGSTIIGWRVSAESVKAMGASSMCLPKEIGEDLERLRIIASWWETGAKERMEKLEAALKDALPDDRETRRALWSAILPLTYTIAAPPIATATPSNADLAGEGAIGSLPYVGFGGELTRDPPIEKRSTHHVHRRHESIPCWCAATTDHAIGREITTSRVTVAFAIVGREYGGIAADNQGQYLIFSTLPVAHLYNQDDAEKIVRVEITQEKAR